MTILANGTPWCVDTPVDLATPRTVHRVTCTGPADGKVVPLHNFAGETEERLRAFVTKHALLRMCPACLPEPSDTDLPKARELGTVQTTTREEIMR